MASAEFVTSILAVLFVIPGMTSGLKIPDLVCPTGWAVCELEGYSSGVFKFHGNYCGPNWCAGQWVPEASCDFGVRPVDCLDACCESHDLCCASTVGRCDLILADCAAECEAWPSSAVDAFFRHAIDRLDSYGCNPLPDCWQLDPEKNKPPTRGPVQDPVGWDVYGRRRLTADDAEVVRWPYGQDSDTFDMRAATDDKVSVVTADLSFAVGGDSVEQFSSTFPSALDFRTQAASNAGVPVSDVYVLHVWHNSTNNAVEVKAFFLFPGDGASSTEDAQSFLANLRSSDSVTLVFSGLDNQPSLVHSCIQHNRTYADLAGLVAASSTLLENDVPPSGNVTSSASRPGNISFCRNAWFASILFLAVVETITWLV